MTKGGDFNACATVMDGGESWAGRTGALRSSAGARRTRNDVGIISTAATPATIRSAVLQSKAETSQAASGAIVIGAMPIPADTSETARLRCVSNHPVTQAIIGAMIAAAPAPTRRPNNKLKLDEGTRPAGERKAT